MSGVWTICRLCFLNQFDPGWRTTHGLGVDQSTSPLQGVTQGGDGERRKRSQRRDRERVSHHYCHSVTHCGQSVSTSVCAGPGRLAGDTLPLLPSILRSPSQLQTHIDEPVLFLIPRILFVCATGIFVMLALFITARHSCQSSHTGSSPRLWDVLFFSSPFPVPGQGHVPSAAVKNSEKNFDIRQGPKPHE